MLRSIAVPARALSVMCFVALTLSCSTQRAIAPRAQPQRFRGPFTWTKLQTEPYRGKQDDIFFVTPQLGFYVNGSGRIYKTNDGGTTWVKLDRPGTYFRCIAFVDDRRGFAGNIGTDYFPGVTDTTPLYETRDGGETWTAVTTIVGSPVKGLCAIDIVKEPFINAGKLDHRIHIHAAGRVGGPSVLVTSHDGGETWEARDMSAIAGMILDVNFLDPKKGIISAASNAAVDKSNALILMTHDAGLTWTKKYQSTRPYETTWKSSFPTPSVGYITIQSYDPDKAVTQRYVAKTTDGGETWNELPLTDDFKVREFGVAFVDADTGWVGTTTTGFETIDGGATWKPVELGKAVNKIRILRTPDGFVGYAIGTEVYKVNHPDHAPTSVSAAP